MRGDGLEDVVPCGDWGASYTGLESSGCSRTRHNASCQVYPNFFFFFLKKSASPSIIVIVYEHQDFKQVSSCPGSSYPTPAGLSQQAVCTGGSALPWEPLRRLHPEAGGTSLPLAPFRGRCRWTLPGSGPRESLSEA